MPQLVKKRRSGWAVLAAGALVASLLAVGSGPAAAVEIEGGEDDPAKASQSTGHSACVGDATDAFGFTDVSDDSVHYDAINCLAYYGVTKGKTAETYAPGDNVTNAQMVLFMDRAADLTGADADDTLGDFAENGSDPVSRTDMAVLLVRLLASAEPSLVQISGEGDVTYTRDKIRLSTGRNGTLDYFADTRPERSRVSRYEDNLITAAYELGITNGTGDGTTFSPHDAVTRAQMASFITRALGHTTVRPAGISAQQVGADVFVSLRDSNFEPVQNASLDAFEVSTSRADDAFRSDGSCARLVDALEGDEGACEIDKNDPLSDDIGDVEYNVGAVRIGKGITVWAWTGDSGDEFEDDTDHVELAVTPFDLDADRALITTSLRPAAQKAKFGSTITITLQLQNTETGDPIDVTDRSNDYQYDVVVEKRVNAALISHTEERLKIDEDGSASFDVTHSDPDPSSNNPAVTVEYEVTPVATTDAPSAPPTHASDVPVADGQDTVGHYGKMLMNLGAPGSTNVVNNAGAAEGAIDFDDDSGVPSIVIIQTDGYEYFDDDGDTVRPTVLVFDQYGLTVGRQSVRLTHLVTRQTADECPSPTDQFADLKSYTTGRRSGAVSVPYSYGGETDDAEGPKLLDAVTAGGDDQFGDGADCAITATSAEHLALGDPDSGNHPADTDDTDGVSPEEFTAYWDTDEDGTVDADDDGDYDEDNAVVPDITVGQAGPTAVEIDERPTFYWLHDDSEASTKAVEISGSIVGGNPGKSEVVVAVDADNNDVGDGGWTADTWMVVIIDDNDRFTTIKDDPDGGDAITSTVDMETFMGVLEGAIDDPGSGTLTWTFYNHRDPDDITNWELDVSTGS